MHAALAAVLVVVAGYDEPAFQATVFEDGHSRPRALAVSTDGLVYAALSTASKVAVLDPAAGFRVRAEIPVCRFPEALVALPHRRVLVSCRFDPDLLIIGEGLETVRVPAGPEHGHRGLAVDATGRFAFVASPALGGVKVLDLVERKVLQVAATGDSPRALRVFDGLLLVSNFVGHTLTVHSISADGLVGPALQTISTHAGVKDFIVAGGKLWLLTHEDRPVDRSDP